MNRILLIAVALAVTATAARAATWHVATTGNDSAAGSASAPWRTIQHASDRVAPGDTVVIHAGSYPGFQVTTVGTQAQPIVFIADGHVTIEGSQTTDRDAVHIEGAAWVTIEGLEVVGAARAGISALDCDHITVRGNKVDSNARWGVFSSFCEDFTVENNEVSRSGTEHGIYASNSADHPVIRGNTIWGNGMCGVHMNGDISYGGDGVISGAVVEDNVITDNGRLGGSAINGDGVTGAVIRNNVLDGNHASGISLYKEDGGAPSTGNQVINNTVRMASDARWAINIQNGSGGNVLRNNVLLHPNIARGAIDACSECITGMISDRNVVVGRFSVGGTAVDLAGWRTLTGGDVTSFVATDAQLFSDPAAGDLTLHAGSPAIDAGVANNAPATDLEGTARPQGAGIDVGAYEYCDGPCVAGDPGMDPGTDPGGGSGPGSGSGDPSSGNPADPQSGQGGGCNASRSGAGMLVGLALLAVRRRQRIAR
jgi:parallel beta-helix repeat protein